MWHVAHQPPQHGDELPAERRTVLVWLATRALPFCGYIRHHSGGPFWVVYHGNTEIGTEVVAWEDTPLTGPTDEATAWIQGHGYASMSVWHAAAQAVLVQQEEERRRIIHRLCAGAPLCGFSRAVPAEWPAEHRWSAYREDITCPDCEAVQAMQQEEETHG